MSDQLAADVAADDVNAGDAAVEPDVVDCVEDDRRTTWSPERPSTVPFEQPLTIPLPVSSSTTRPNTAYWRPKVVLVSRKTEAAEEEAGELSRQRRWNREPSAYLLASRCACFDAPNLVSATDQFRFRLPATKFIYFDYCNNAWLALIWSLSLFIWRSESPNFPMMQSRRGWYVM